MVVGQPTGSTAPAEGQVELALTNKQTGASDGGGTTDAASSFGADLVSYPFTSFANAHLPQHNTRRNFQSYSPGCDDGNMRLGGYIDLNGSVYSNTNANMIDIRNDVPEFHSESGMSCSEVSMRNLSRTSDGNNTMGSEYWMNRTVPSREYPKSEIQKNLVPLRGETAIGYPMKVSGEEAKTSGVSRLGTSEDFTFLGRSTSLSPIVDNYGAPKNDINITPVPSDRNFLTLGTGSGTRVRPSSNFVNQEIASKFGGASLPQSNSSHLGQSPQNPLSFVQLTSGAARTQDSAGRLSNLASNLVRRMPAFDERGLIRDTDARLNLMPRPSSQTTQANFQPSFLAESNTFDIGLNSSLSFARNSIGHPEFAASSALRPQPTMPPYSARQSTSNRQQDYYRKNYMNVPFEFPSNRLPERHRGIPISHGQPGRSIPFAEGIQSQTSDNVLSPMSVRSIGNVAALPEGTRTEVAKISSSQSSVQPLGTLQSVSSGEAIGKGFPERTGFQTPNGSSFQSVAGSQFPRRLGVQPNEFATGRTAIGNPHQTQDGRLVDYFQNPVRPHPVVGSPPVHLVDPFRSSISSGQHPYSMAARFSKDFYPNGPPPVRLVAPFRPSVCSGQIPSSMPTGSIKDFHPSVQVGPVTKLDVRSQVSPIVRRPSLKRQASENPPAANQRTKIIPESVIQHSLPLKMQSIPAPIPVSFHIPPAPDHVKWQGFDEPPKQTGHRCLLCKRDLSFTAEGDVFQPAIPPAVAVLPCGHAFHDRCLELITPEGQSEHPPCIPCAIGEA